MARFDNDRGAVRAVVEDVAPGSPAYRVAQLWDGLHRQHLDPSEVTVLPKGLRARLAGHPALAPALSLVRAVDADNGTTVKWLWQLADGPVVETVLMRYPSWSTVCVSTQAGSAMACGFSATGQAGFERQLQVGEIVEQVSRACRSALEAGGPPVSRVVFMGMGEPLANYDASWGAVERLHGDFGLSARHLTISTVGIVPGIRRLASEPLPVNLAVSLHAADDAKRDSLVPVNRRYPLAVLRGALEAYIAAKRRRVSFEWALISGVNDGPDDAGGLAAFALPLGAHVNLIPLNPTPGYAVRGSSPAAVRAFRDRLRDAGVNVTVRQTRGRSIDAACGQLAGAVSGGGERSVRLGRLPH